MPKYLPSHLRSSAPAKLAGHRAGASVDALAGACGFGGGADDLCAAHSEALLDALAARSAEWSADSPDRLPGDSANHVRSNVAERLDWT